MDFTKHIQTMLRHGGSNTKVTFGSSTTWAMEDIASVDAFERGRGAVKAKLRSILIQTDSLEGLREGSTVKVNGTAFEVLEINLVDEGALQRLDLRDA